MLCVCLQHCHLGGRWGVEVGCMEICGVEVWMWNLWCVKVDPVPACPLPVLELEAKTLGVCRQEN